MNSLRLALAAILLGNMPALAARHAGGAPVIMSAQPGSPQDRIARQLNAQDLNDAARHGDTPLVLVGSAHLSTTKGRDAALFVQLQSAALCGSAGCSTSVYVQHRRSWKKVLDSVTGPISVLATAHAGMHDLRVGRNDRWIWDGKAYRDTLSAPPLPDLRRSARRHAAAVQ